MWGVNLGLGGEGRGWKGYCAVWWGFSGADLFGGRNPNVEARPVRVIRVQTSHLTTTASGVSPTPEVARYTGSF